jgi:hypothetical protein
VRCTGGFNQATSATFAEIAVGSGLLANELTTPVEQALAGRWPAALRRAARACTRRRRAAWVRANQEWERARDAGDHDRLAALAERRNRIAWIEPINATWIGDRLNAPTLRAHQEYGVDLTFRDPRGGRRATRLRSHHGCPRWPLSGCTDRHSTER